MLLDEVAPGVWRAGTRFVNWYLVDAGAAGLTMVDAGLPRYAGQLDAVLARLGRRREDVAALVLTHGHVDHAGGAHDLAGPGTRIFLHPADAGLAEDPRTNVTEKPLWPYLFWPATAGFVVHAVAQGAVRPAPMPPTSPMDDGATLEVPGRPRVVHAPGHTDGSCVLEFAEHGVAFVGDLLCTVSPLTARTAPAQLQTRGSNRDSARALASLDRLDTVRSRVILPGHGAPWFDGPEAAAASARRVGCR